MTFPLDPRECGDDHSLALWVTPDAIREAYEDEDDADNPTIGKTDEELAKVGFGILDGIYDEYRRLLDLEFE